MHGGAGVDPKLPAERQEAAKQLLSRCLNLGISALRSNCPAIDIVELVVKELKTDPLFNSGGGSALTEHAGWSGSIFAFSVSSKMKTILSSETMDIPDVVKIKINTEVEGPRGKLSHNFEHLNLDFHLMTDEEIGKRKLKIDAWFGSRKTSAAIRTALSHVGNLITGVTKGYRYKMRFVYAHFPINASIDNGNKSIEIRNFLGEKVRKVDMLDGVSVIWSDKVKDELILDGNDIELVSRSTILINQKCHVKNKDIRKFLDGIYVSEKSTIFEEARDAKDAIRGRDGYDLDGHRLQVELAHGGRGRSSSDRHSSYSRVLNWWTMNTSSLKRIDIIGGAKKAELEKLQVAQLELFVQQNELIKDAE